MDKNNKTTTPLSTFRRAAVNTLRESNPDFEEAVHDPPVEFYLITNMVASGNPKSTLSGILNMQAAKQVDSSAVTISEVDKDAEEANLNLEAGTSGSSQIPNTSNSMTSPNVDTETVAPHYVPFPMPRPIKQTVTSKSTPLQIKKTVTRSTSPIRSQMVDPMTSNCTQTSQPENILPPMYPRPLSSPRQRARVVKAAEVAVAATSAARVQQNARDDIGQKKGLVRRMIEIANRNNPTRLARNENLLNSALKIINEMDQAYLEVLCYAIHDRASNNEW